MQGLCTDIKGRDYDLLPKLEKLSIPALVKYLHELHPIGVRCGDSSSTAQSSRGHVDR